MGVKLGLSYEDQNVGRLWLFESRVLRKLFVSKREEVTGGVEKTA